MVIDSLYHFQCKKLLHTTHAIVRLDAPPMGLFRFGNGWKCNHDNNAGESGIGFLLLDNRSSILSIDKPPVVMRVVVGGLLLLLPLSHPRGVNAQITLVDDVQRRVSLAAPAQRIVSLAPSITETLFAIGAGEQVVGVTTYCNFPAAARGKRHVGGMTTPNVETIMSLTPDLIVMSMEGNLRDCFEKLSSLGIPVFVSNPRSLTGIYRSLEQLGSLTGHRLRATMLIDSLRGVEDSLRRATKGATKQRCLFIVSLQPIIVVGAKTFLGELIASAGGINVGAVGPSSYPTLSREVVLRDDPEVIVVMSDAITDVSDIPKIYPEWATVSAARNGRIYRLDADILSRPGPRAVQGLQDIITLFQKGQQ